MTAYNADEALERAEAALCTSAMACAEVRAERDRARGALEELRALLKAVVQRDGAIFLAPEGNWRLLAAFAHETPTTTGARPILVAPTYREADAYLREGEWDAPPRIVTTTSTLFEVMRGSSHLVVIVLNGYRLDNNMGTLLDQEIARRNLASIVTVRKVTW